MCVCTYRSHPSTDPLTFFKNEIKIYTRSYLQSNGSKILLRRQLVLKDVFFKLQIQTGAKSTFARVYFFFSLLFYGCILSPCIKISKVNEREKVRQPQFLVYRSQVFAFHSARILAKSVIDSNPLIMSPTLI